MTVCCELAALVILVFGLKKKQGQAGAGDQILIDLDLPCEDLSPKSCPQSMGRLEPLFVIGAYIASAPVNSLQRLALKM